MFLLLITLFCLLQELLQQAPAVLLQLEFQAAEVTFLQNIELAEKTLKQQTLAVQQKSNLQEILHKHKVGASHSQQARDIDPMLF